MRGAGGLSCSSLGTGKTCGCLRELIVLGADGGIGVLVDMKPSGAT